MYNRFEPERCQDGAKRGEMLVHPLPLRLPKSLPMKLHRLAQVRQEVLQAVISWIQVILMRNLQGLQFAVQRASALVKPQVIALPAIEINRQSAQTGCVPPRQRH